MEVKLSLFLLSILLPVCFCDVVDYSLGLFFPFSASTDGERPVPSAGGLARTDFLQVAFAVAAVKQVNSRQGSVIPFLQNLSCDINMSYSIYDTGRDYSLALKQFLVLQEDNQKEIKANSLGIVGAQRSSVTTPLAFVSYVQRIPMISYASTSTHLDDKDVYPYLFRTIPSDKELINVIVSFLKEFNIPQVALLYIEDNYGKSFKDGFLEECERKGVIMESAPYEPEIEGSIESALGNIKDTELNVIVGVIFQDSLSKVMRTARRMGLTEGKLWLFGDAIGSYSNIKSDGQENIEFAQAMNNSLQILPVARDISVDAYKRLLGEVRSFNFATEVQERLPGYEKYVGNKDFEYTFPLVGYDIFQSLDEGEICDFCLLAFDSVISYAKALDLKCSLESQRDREVSEILKRDSFGFDGVTGRVEFDQETLSRKFESSKFSVQRVIFNRQASALSMPEQGYFKEGWYLPEEMNVPRFADIPETTTNDVSSGAKIFAYMLASLLLLFVIFTHSWLELNREEQVIKVSQPVFLKLILVGIVVSTSSAYLKGYNPSDFGYNLTFELEHNGGDSLENPFRSDILTIGRLCNGSWWMVSLGLSLTNLGFIVKLFKIVEIFKASAQFKRLSSIPSNMVLFQRSLVALAINVCLLLYLTAVSPMVYKETVLRRDVFGQPTEVSRKCSVESSGNTGFSAFVQTMSYIALVGFHMSQYGVGIYLSYASRNLPSDFQEAKWLSIAFFTQFQLIILGSTILFAVNAEDQDTHILVTVLLTVLINGTILGLIFGPKMFRLMYGEKEVSLETNEKKRKQGPT